MKRDVTFILVRPQYAGNMGSVARALKNTGFSKLVLVEPKESPTSLEARKMAVGAYPLLKKAKVVKTIREATTGLKLLFATSCRAGRKRGEFLPLPEITHHLPEQKKIGILFGPEDRGLTTEELFLCHRVVTIPTQNSFKSLNLAQAVLLVAYQIKSSMKGSLPVATVPKKLEKLAPVQDIEQMYDHFEKMLGEIGFFPHQNPFAVMRKLRRIFARTELTEREVRMLRGICQQTLWRTTQQGEA